MGKFAEFNFADEQFSDKDFAHFDPFFSKKKKSNSAKISSEKISSLKVGFLGLLKTGPSVTFNVVIGRHIDFFFYKNIRTVKIKLAKFKKLIRIYHLKIVLKIHYSVWTF